MVRGFEAASFGAGGTVFRGHLGASGRFLRADGGGGLEGVAQQRCALNAWGWQLAMGAAWPAVFFGFHGLFPALIIAGAQVAAVGLTLWRFARRDGVAAILLAPYLAFAGFAGYLNAGFWWFNH